MASGSHFSSPVDLGCRKPVEEEGPSFSIKLPSTENWTRQGEEETRPSFEVAKNSIFCSIFADLLGLNEDKKVGLQFRKSTRLGGGGLHQAGSLAH